MPDDYDWAEPLHQRERIERAYLRPYRCPRCGADVPDWATEVIDEGHGRVCLMCAATDYAPPRGEVF